MNRPLARPSGALSLLVHAALATTFYYFGGYRLEKLDEQAAVVSSLRETDMASAAERLHDLEIIEQLLEKSADRDEPRAAEPTPEKLAPRTPEEMLERARDLSEAIAALDQEIRAEDLAKSSGEAATPTAVDAPPDDARPMDAPPTAAPPLRDAPAAASRGPRPAQHLAVTAEMAAGEIAALEARARETLARRQAQLEARAQGMQIELDGGALIRKGAGAGIDANPAGSAVRAEIAAFIDSGQRGAAVAALQAGAGGGDIEDTGDVLVPPVDASGLVLGQGRIIGAGGEYANRIHVNSWYIIGPFAGGRRGRLRGNPVYPPEKAVILDAVYFGKGGQLVKWRYVSSPTYPLLPPETTSDAIYYGYTEVSVDEDCDLTAWIGADDDAEIYFNDRLIWPGGTATLMKYLQAIWESGANHLRDYNLTEGRRVLHFNKGRNKVFFKLSNGAQGTHVSFVLTR
jgi:hypothetical protein